ncbi:MAG: glycosyltransferase family 39 protein [Phycisphaerales bacterium]|nr:MAG: glycosyltransferase family 39 protein [Phycisphaerales bacterium]
MDTQSGEQPQANELSMLGETGHDSARARPPLGRTLLVLTAAWAVIFTAAGTWSAYWSDLRNDQYQLIYLGQRVYDGGRMYVDCWENKPPGIAWINALGIAASRGGQLGAWLLPGLTMVLSLAVFGYALTRTLSVIAACGTVLIAAVVWSLRLYDTPSINPDFYSSMFELTACSLWLVSLDTTRGGRRFWLGIGAGLLWAAAASVKQTGIVGLLAVSIVAIVLVALKRDDKRHWAVTGAWTWIGIVLGLAVVAAVLAYRQTFGAASEAVFAFNRGLFNSEDVAAAVTSWSRLRAGLSPVQLALWLGLVGVIATLHSSRANRLTRAVIGAMLLWWAGHVLLALLGPSRSMRYWQATFPAMLWLAGAGIYHFEDIFRRLEKGYRSALVVVCVTVVVLLARALAEHYQHGLATSHLAYAAEETQRDRLDAVGEQIGDIVPEGETIYVWAYDAGVYLYANRPAASRFTYPRSTGQISEILSDLADRKPYLLLISEGGSAEFDRWCDDPCQHRLDEILARYEVRTVIGRYQAWVRLEEHDESPPAP